MKFDILYALKKYHNRFVFAGCRKCGIVTAIYNAFNKTRSPLMNEANTQRAIEAWNRRAASARLEKEICEFSEKFSGVSLSDVPDEVWEEVKKGISLSEAFAEYKEGADNEQRETD